MEKMVHPDLVGFRFRPTHQEIIDHYLSLRPKNMDGKTSHVDKDIDTADIYSFDPCELPSQSSSIRNDNVCYFFGGKDNKYNRGERQIRKKSSGFWKKTGVIVNTTSPTPHDKKEEELGHQQWKPITQLKTPTSSLTTVNTSAFTKNKQSTESAIKLENGFSLLAENDI